MFHFNPDQNKTKQLTFQSSFRAVSEQFQSSFRAVSAIDWPIEFFLSKLFTYMVETFALVITNQQITISEWKD